MMLSPFKWWLSNAPATAWRSISQTVLDYIESKIRTTFALARIGTTSPTGEQIFWEDAHIKPPVAESLKKKFLQTYKQFMKKVGKSASDELVKDYFGLDFFYSQELRDGPLLSQIYPFHVVRFWIPPETSNETVKEIRDFLMIVLPARCTRHFQLIPHIETGGFGRTPFGKAFGR